MVELAVVFFSVSWIVANLITWLNIGNPIKSAVVATFLHTSLLTGLHICQICLVTLVTCWSCKTVILWLGCLHMQVYTLIYKARTSYCNISMSILKLQKNTSIFFIFCYDFAVLKRFYLYIPIYSYKPKSFRAESLLSTGVLNHIARLLQTMIRWLWNSWNIVDFYHCIILQEYNRMYFPTFTCSLN